MRRLIIGTRLWPPASTRASPPCSARRRTASSMVVGAKYRKAGGFMFQADAFADRFALSEAGCNGTVSGLYAKHQVGSSSYFSHVLSFEICWTLAVRACRFAS